MVLLPLRVHTFSFLFVTGENSRCLIKSKNLFRFCFTFYAFNFHQIIYWAFHLSVLRCVNAGVGAVCVRAADRHYGDDAQSFPQRNAVGCVLNRIVLIRRFYVHCLNSILDIRAVTREKCVCVFISSSWMEIRTNFERNQRRKNRCLNWWWVPYLSLLMKTDKAQKLYLCNGIFNFKLLMDWDGEWIQKSTWWMAWKYFSWNFFQIVCNRLFSTFVLWFVLTWLMQNMIIFAALPWVILPFYSLG